MHLIYNSRMSLSFAKKNNIISYNLNSLLDVYFAAYHVHSADLLLEHPRVFRRNHLDCIELLLPSHEKTSTRKDHNRQHVNMHHAPDP